MSKRLFEDLPEMGRKQMHELLLENENTLIEVYEFFDGAMLLYRGKKDYFVIARPNETVFLDSVVGEPLYNCRRNEDCIDIIEGRDDCDFFENMSYCLNKLTE